MHDDRGQPVAILELPAREQMHAILRYSAIPGSSRHHWGTDLDVYDAAAMAPGYSLQLSPGEVASGGVFDPLHCWLDERMAAGQSHGFYRPYAADRGGVAPERWHLSYAPLSASCALQLSGDLLRSCWDWTEADEPLLLRDVIESDLQQIMARYVAVRKDWQRRRELVTPTVPRGGCLLFCLGLCVQVAEMIFVILLGSGYHLQRFLATVDKIDLDIDFLARDHLVG